MFIIARGIPTLPHSWATWSGNEARACIKPWSTPGMCPQFTCKTTKTPSGYSCANLALQGRVTGRATHFQNNASGLYSHRVKASTGSDFTHCLLQLLLWFAWVNAGYGYCQWHSKPAAAASGKTKAFISSQHKYYMYETVRDCNLSSVQFCSFWFDNPGMLHLQHRGGFHAGPGPH